MILNHLITQLPHHTLNYSGSIWISGNENMMKKQGNWKEKCNKQQNAQTGQ